MSSQVAQHKVGRSCSQWEIVRGGSDDGVVKGTSRSSRTRDAENVQDAPSHLASEPHRHLTARISSLAVPLFSAAEPRARHTILIGKITPLHLISGHHEPKVPDALSRPIDQAWYEILRTSHSLIALNKRGRATCQPHRPYSPHSSSPHAHPPYSV